MSFRSFSVRLGIVTRVALAADFSSASTSFQSASPGYLCSPGLDVGTTCRIFTGDIAEFIAIRRAVSSTELSTIENSLKTKYAL
jgi:hypothetical protein